MEVQVYRGDGTGPLWPEQVETARLQGNVLAFFSPRSAPHVRVGDVLLLRESARPGWRVRVDVVLARGTYFVVSVLGPGPAGALQQS
jgi:hypothetical protein